MRDNHITEMLDNKPLASLKETELAAIRSHVAGCASCERAYEAAQLSALLIKERADEAAQSSLVANPFFQTRVMAAWRILFIVNVRLSIMSAEFRVAASMAVICAA